jgi:hypothetical protein
MSSSLQALWNKLSDLNGDLQRLKNVIKKIKNLENQLARLRRNSKVSPQQNNQMDTRLQNVMLALGKAKNSRDIQNMGTEVRKINDQLKAMEENSPAEKKPATPPTVNKPHSPHSREDKSRKPSFPNQGIGWFSPSSDSESNSKPHSPHPREDKSRKFSFPNQGVGWFSPSSDSKPDSKPHIPIHGRTIHILFKR